MKKIEYLDFTSLYPFVNKTKIYPSGHPTIIRENFEPISNYFGLIKCKVLAPANLYHPVLPVRAKGKLFSPYVSNVSWTTLQMKGRDLSGAHSPQSK